MRARQKTTERDTKSRFSANICPPASQPPEHASIPGINTSRVEFGTTHSVPGTDNQQDPTAVCCDRCPTLPRAPDGQHEWTSARTNAAMLETFRHEYHYGHKYKELLDYMWVPQWFLNLCPEMSYITRHSPPGTSRASHFTGNIIRTDIAYITYIMLQWDQSCTSRYIPGQVIICWCTSCCSGSARAANV